MKTSKFRKAAVTGLLILMLTLAGGVRADGPGSGTGVCTGSWCGG